MMLLLSLPATSKVEPAREDQQRAGEEDRASPRPAHEVEHQVARQREQVDAANLAATAVAVAKQREGPHERDRRAPVRVTHAERIGPGTTKPRARATMASPAENATPGTVGSSLSTSTMKATTATTANAPAAAPNTCAKPGRGRRCARRPSRETSPATTSPVIADQAVGELFLRTLEPPSPPGSSPASFTLRYAPTTRPADEINPRKMPILRSLETPLPLMSTPPVPGPVITLMRMKRKATIAMPRMMCDHLTEPSSGRATARPAAAARGDPRRGRARQRRRRPDGLGAVRARRSAEGRGRVAPSSAHARARARLLRAALDGAQPDRLRRAEQLHRREDAFSTRSAATAGRWGSPRR